MIGGGGPSQAEHVGPAIVRELSLAGTVPKLAIGSEGAPPPACVWGGGGGAGVRVCVCACGARAHVCVCVCARAAQRFEQMHSGRSHTSHPQLRSHCSNAHLRPPATAPVPARGGNAVGGAASFQTNLVQIPSESPTTIHRSTGASPLGTPPSKGKGEHWDVPPRLDRPSQSGGVAHGRGVRASVEWPCPNAPPSSASPQQGEVPP